MTRKMHGAIVGALSVVALLLAADETFARSGAASHGGAATHRTARAPVAHSPRHVRKHFAGSFWPGFYDPSLGGPVESYVAPTPTSGDVRNTYVYDVPWDWAHRYPPNVIPSDRPYVPSCSTEKVTVPGNDETAHAVNVIRCY